MYYLYKLTNTVSGTVYYGISCNPQQRLAAHRHVAKRGKLKSPLADAMRSYGVGAFMLTVEAGPMTRELAYETEVAIIAANKRDGVKTYNLHPGGSGGFSILEKSPEEVEQWRVKQRAARVGKKPALGMQHTAENKKLFGQYGKLRWDIHGRYPDTVLDFGFTEANKRFGISKTHYYRLRKQRNASDAT